MSPDSQTLQKNNFAVIGNPVDHSLSPAMHNWIFNRLGIHATTTAIQIGANNLGKSIDLLRTGKLDGMNVTIPHKKAIIPFLDDVDIKARQMDSVNCVVKNGNLIIGYNTDWYGFAMTLKENRIKIAGRQCIIVGAGGVARSVLYALLREPVAAVFVANRTLHRAESLVSSLEKIKGKTRLEAIPLEKVKSCILSDSVVINCTSLGMSSTTDPAYIELTPLPQDLLRKDLVLMDTIYHPLKTQFLKKGDALGCQTVGGLNMFIHQGLASLELWLGKPISQQIEIDALKSYLTSQLIRAHILEKDKRGA